LGEWYAVVGVVGSVVVVDVLVVEYAFPVDIAASSPYGTGVFFQDWIVDDTYNYIRLIIGCCLTIAAIIIATIIIGK